MTRDVKEEVRYHLPAFLFESELFSENMDSPASEMNDLTAAVEDVLDQFFIDTADWGLAEWEEFLGIKTDETKPLNDRRSVIKSKKRGVGTVTISLMKNVAQAYERGSIDVTEQPALYQFTVHFIDTLGAPPNIDDLKAAIEEIKPAHLSVSYSFRYLTIAEVEGMTISQIENTTLDRFAGGGM